jgi:hypothetical protein
MVCNDRKTQFDLLYDGRAYMSNRDSDRQPVRLISS